MYEGQSRFWPSKKKNQCHIHSKLLIENTIYAWLRVYVWYVTVKLCCCLYVGQDMLMDRVLCHMAPNTGVVDCRLSGPATDDTDDHAQSNCSASDQVIHSACVYWPLPLRSATVSSWGAGVFLFSPISQEFSLCYLLTAKPKHRLGRPFSVLLQNRFLALVLPNLKFSTNLDKILHTPIVVRNTFVGRLRPQSARGRFQAKPERLWFITARRRYA